LNYLTPVNRMYFKDRLTPPSTIALCKTLELNIMNLTTKIMEDLISSVKLQCYEI